MNTGRKENRIGLGATDAGWAVNEGKDERRDEKEAVGEVWHRALS